MPKFEAPDVKMPEMPEFKAPEMPKFSMPTMPKLDMPEMPKVDIPDKPAAAAPAGKCCTMFRSTHTIYRLFDPSSDIWNDCDIRACLLTD